MAILSRDDAGAVALVQSRHHHCQVFIAGGGAAKINQGLTKAGVSIIFKIRVFHKARFEGFEFFIRWPYAAFHKMQVVFYKSAHFMYL